MMLHLYMKPLCTVYVLATVTICWTTATYNGRMTELFYWECECNISNS